jgi:hypothetical protein
MSVFARTSDPVPRGTPKKSRVLVYRLSIKRLTKTHAAGCSNHVYPLPCSYPRDEVLQVVEELGLMSVMAETHHSR